MEKYSQDDIRRKIIGLGESSVRKSYYPLLQEKIFDLEEKQRQLMETVRTLEEREVELEKLLEEKDALLHEVNHRVKNNLQIITSLLNMAAHAPAKSFEKSFHDSLKQVETISVIYQDFIFSESYTEVTLLAFLKLIAVNVRADSSKHDVEIGFELPDEEVIISIDCAIPLALIINEALSNAFQHAFTDNVGRLIITVQASEKAEKNWILSICDTGPGLAGSSCDMKNGEHVSEGFGIQLISALSLQIGAEYSYTDTGDGACFKIEFKE